MDGPRISVIIPTRNRVEGLKRSLDSLLQDDYRNKEILVMDGASTDGTIELLRSYGSRIAWASAEDAGEYDATNKGIRRATGAIIKQMTDDDVHRPGALRVAADFMFTHPDVDIMFGQHIVWAAFPGRERFVLRGPISPDRLDLSLRNWVRRTRPLPCYQAAFFRRDLFDRLGYFRTDFTGGDYEFFARAARMGARMIAIGQVVVDFNLTGDNGIFRNAWKVHKDGVRIACMHGDGLSRILAICRAGVYGLALCLGRGTNSIGWHPVRDWQEFRSRHWERAKDR